MIMDIVEFRPYSANLERRVETTPLLAVALGPLCGWCGEHDCLCQARVSARALNKNICRNAGTPAKTDDESFNWLLLLHLAIFPKSLQVSIACRIKPSTTKLFICCSRIPVQLVELHYACRRCKSPKTPGHDGVHVRFVSWCSRFACLIKTWSALFICFQQSV